MARNMAGPGFTKIKGYSFTTDAGIQLEIQWHVNPATSEFAVSCKHVDKVWKIPGAGVEKIDVKVREELKSYAEGDWVPHIEFSLKVRHQDPQSERESWDDGYRKAGIQLHTRKREFNADLGKMRLEPTSSEHRERCVRDEKPEPLGLEVSRYSSHEVELGGDFPEKPTVLAGISELQQALENLGTFLQELGIDAPDSMGSNYAQVAAELTKFVVKQRDTFEVSAGRVAKQLKRDQREREKRRRGFGYAVTSVGRRKSST